MRETATDTDVLLDCAAVGHEAVRVKWQYINAKLGERETRGTLHLSRTRFLALVRCLRQGGARVRLSGSYPKLHPEVR